MQQFLFSAGATSKTIDVFLPDSSSTTGAGLTGLVYNSAGLKAYYRIGPTGTSTAVTLATQTVGGAYSSGGFVETDATNQPGMYRFDIPNAVLASNGVAVLYFSGATNLAPVPVQIQIGAAVDATSWAGTAITASSLPVATAAGAAGGLLIAGSNAATTFATVTCTGAFTLSDGLLVSRSTLNGSAITATGNGTGSGAVFTSGSGASGDGLKAVSAATNGNGLSCAGNGTGAGGNFQSGAGASANGVQAQSNAASGTGNGFSGLGAQGGDGMMLTGGATGRGLHVLGGSTSGAGFRAEGNPTATAGYGMHIIGIGANDGLRIDAGTGNAVDVTGPAVFTSTLTVSGALTATNASNSITGVSLAANQDVRNVTGNVSGSVGSVTSAVTVGTNNDKAGYSLSSPQTFNLTGDITGNLSGSAGSVTSPVTVGTNNDKTGYTLTSAGYEAGADALLGRNIAGGSSTGRTVYQALAVLRNKIDTTSTPGTMSVYGTDDTTLLWSATLTTDAAAEPIVASDPS